MCALDSRDHCAAVDAVLHHRKGRFTQEPGGASQYRVRLILSLVNKDSLITYGIVRHRALCHCAQTGGAAAGALKLCLNGLRETIGGTAAIPRG
jgi:hypothetical protein